jgi:MFS family permease
LRPIRSALLALWGSIALVAASVPATAPLLAAPLRGGGRPGGPRSLLRRTLRYATAEGAVAEVIAACAGVTVVTGWALHLGASRLEVGLVGALPMLAQVAQLPAAWLTCALGRRRVALVAVALSRLALLPLAALPFLPVGRDTARQLLLAVAGLSAALAVVGNNAWVAWMGELVPEGVRGRYFGRRTALATVAGTAAALGAGRLLDAAAASPEATGRALAALALVAVACGLAAAVLMARQHEPAGIPAERPSLGAILRPMQGGSGRAFLAYQGVWNAAVGLGGGYFAFHLLHNLEAGFTVVAVHAAGIAAARVISAPLWGRAIDRLGARPVLAACSYAVAVLPLVWLLPSPGNLWPIAIDAVIGGVAWGGHGLAAFGLPLAVAPRRERPFYLASFAAAGGLSHALAVAAGGALAAALPARFEVMGTGAHAVQVLFVLSALGRFAAAFLALRVGEEGAASLGELRRRTALAARLALVTLLGGRARAPAGPVGPS